MQDPGLHEGLVGDREAGGADEERTGKWREAQHTGAEREAAIRLEAGHQASSMDEEDADAGEYRRQPHAEGHDQHQPEADTLQSDGAEHHDECGRARQQAAGDAEREQVAPGEGRAVGTGWHMAMDVTIAMIMLEGMVIVMMRVMMIVDMLMLVGV